MKFFFLALTLLCTTVALAATSKNVSYKEAATTPCKLCFTRLKAKVRFQASWSSTNIGD